MVWERKVLGAGLRGGRWAELTQCLPGKGTRLHRAPLQRPCHLVKHIMCVFIGGLLSPLSVPSHTMETIRSNCVFLRDLVWEWRKMSTGWSQNWIRQTDKQRQADRERHSTWTNCHYHWLSVTPSEVVSHMRDGPLFHKSCHKQALNHCFPFPLGQLN